MSRAFELLTGEPGVTVGRNGDSFLRIGADAESISAVNALLLSKELKVYELSPKSLEEAFLRLTKTGAVPPNE